MEDAHGMRIEGDGHGESAQLAGAAHHFGEDVLMGAVDTVEVADAEDGAAQVVGKFLEMAV